MSIFVRFEEKLRGEAKSIVFTEGTDARILSAASRLLAGKTLRVILLGAPDAVQKAAADGGFDITGAEILDPAAYEGNIHVVACDDALHLEDTHGTKMRFDYADLRVVYPTSEFVVAGFGGKRYVYVPRSALSEGRFRELVRILDAHLK